MSLVIYEPGVFAHLLDRNDVDAWADGEIDAWTYPMQWVRKTTRRREMFLHDPAAIAMPLSYSYGPRNTYASSPMEPAGLVLRIMRSINIKLGSNLNVCFLNRYDHERDGLAWHADDEESLDDSQPIPVVSFGAERYLHTREKGHKGGALPEDRYKLGHGSQLTMPPGYQETHDHQIPGGTEPLGTRVSLTYRSMFVPEFARVR